MAALMDLVAGEAKEILLAVSVDDWTGLDPTWLDLFSEACRSISDSGEPRDFLDARQELGDDAVDVGERTVERVDHGWVAAVAGVADRDIDGIAGRWVDLLDEEFGVLPREEKPWIRTLAADLVGFARTAAGSRDVLFAWSL